MTTALKALYTFFLILGMLGQTTLASGSERAVEGTSGASKCCGVNGRDCPLKCRSLGCCRQGHAPVSVPNLPNPDANDWMTAAPAPSLPPVSIALLPHAPVFRLPPVPADGVPLYQRNCAYLL